MTAIRISKWRYIKCLLPALVYICTVFSPLFAAETTAPAVNRPAPAFSGTDVDGVKHSLADYKGRPVAVFFFCGCEWCAPVADLWGQMQHGGTLQPTDKAAKAPITLIVYSGDANSARSFARAHALDQSSTVLLPDPEMSVTLDTYHVDPCPRVFMVDQKGILRYTNNHPDDTARKTPALAMVSRAVNALRTPEFNPPQPAAVPQPELDTRPDPATLSLNVLPDDGVKLTSSIDVVFDFGTVNQLSTPKVEHTFVVRNNNTVAVEIGRFETSCACLTTVVTENAGSIEPYMVPPGQQAHIHVTLDTTHLPSGEFHRKIALFLGAQKSPNRVFDLTGTLHAAVSIDPSDVKFEAVPAGEAPTRTVTVTIDPEVYSAAKKWDLTCSLPEIKITPFDAAPLTRNALSGSKDVERKYLLTLSKHAYLGPFSGTLSLTGTGQHPQFTDMAVVHGEVDGEFTVAPSNIVFGAVATGETASMVVFINGVTPTALQNLKVQSASPGLVARVAAPDPRSPTVAAIHLDLQPKPKAGIFQTMIMVKSHNGDVMMIPVTANVVSPVK